MINLTTTYLGLNLKNPVVASSSPLSKKLEDIKRLEESGISAIVMYSLFEEQIEQESLILDYNLNRGSESFAETLSYFPEMENYNIGPDKYLNHIRNAKESVDIPIIGSLNGFTRGGWIQYAKLIEEAGADALELNIYFIPSDLTLSSVELEKKYIHLVSDISEKIEIPLAVKLSPYFTSLPHLCTELVSVGAQGLVLFNRFYQPDLDIEQMEVVPNLELSKSNELRLPLRWIAMLYGRIQADFALTSGVHTGKDVVKSLLAGAKVAMVASELLQNGIQQTRSLITELEEWLHFHQYESTVQLIGSMSQKSVAEPAAFERANYMKVLTSMDRDLNI